MICLADRFGYMGLRSVLGLTVGFIVCFTAAANADDWPQWQGPDRDAVSREKGLLQEWPKGGPRLVWTAKDLGGGDSTPSIAAGRIYGMSNRGNDEVVWAISESDGKPV